MSVTNSIAFPNMFSISTNQVSVYEDLKSVANRSRLLILSEPTSLYNNPDFGVGLRRHIWKYNNENEVAIIQDRIVQQLALHEPCVVPQQTQFSVGLAFTGSPDNTGLVNSGNNLDMTVALHTTFGDITSIDLNDK